MLNHSRYLHCCVKLHTSIDVQQLRVQIAAKLDSALVEAGHADLVVQEIAVMVQAGFSKEAAMLARKNLLLGNQVQLHPCH